MRALFDNGKPAVINGLRKRKNPCSWLVIFLTFLLNKRYILISLILLFVTVIPKTVIHEIPLVIFLPIILNPTSTIISLFNFLVPVLFNSFKNEFVIEFANNAISLIGGMQLFLQRIYFWPSPQKLFNLF